MSHIISLFQNFHFPIEVVLNSLQAQRSLGLVSMRYLRYNFLIKSWSNFITRWAYFPTYSVQRISCFILDISWCHEIKNEKNFSDEIKTFFLVSKVLCSLLNFKTAKNISGITFKFLFKLKKLKKSWSIYNTL